MDTAVMYFHYEMGEKGRITFLQSRSTDSFILAQRSKYLNVKAKRSLFIIFCKIVWKYAHACVLGSVQALLYAHANLEVHIYKLASVQLHAYLHTN